MAVREFTDSTGVEWRVWDVSPQHMHPATRTEDFMGNFQDGWLVFESAAGKRRMEAPYPAEWISLPLTALEGLCQRAAPVVRRSAQSTTGQQRAAHSADLEAGAIRSAHAQVTFRSPAGREWTVRIHECTDRAGSEQTVLTHLSERTASKSGTLPQSRRSRERGERGRLPSWHGDNWRFTQQRGQAVNALRWHHNGGRLEASGTRDEGRSGNFSRVAGRPSSVRSNIAT